MALPHSSVKKESLVIKRDSSSSRDVYAVWDWKGDKDQLENFSWEWYYYANKTWFGPASSGTSPYKAMSCTYNPPENATEVEVRVKPISKKHKVKVKDSNGKEKEKEQDFFNGDWRNTVFVFKKQKPKKIAVKTVSVVHDAYGLVGSWTVESDDKRYIGEYNYSWKYTRPGSKVIHSGEEGTASKDISSLSYTPPADASVVTFKITPVSVAPGAYVGQGKSDKYQIDKKDRQVTGLSASRPTGGNREIRASWSIKSKTYVESFDVEWSAWNGSIWDNYTTNSVPVDQTADNNNSLWINTYTLADDCITARVRVKPVSSEANVVYKDSWSSPVECQFNPPTKIIQEKYKDEKGKEKTGIIISTVRSDIFTRELFARFRLDPWDKVETFETKLENGEINTSGFECEWRYHVKDTSQSVIIDDKTETVNLTKYVKTDSGVRWVSTYTAPSNADYVEFRVKPVPKYSNVYSGEWSDYIKHSFAGIPIKTVSEVLIHVYSYENRTVYAGIKLKKTDWPAKYLNDIASFSYEWWYQYQPPGVKEARWFMSGSPGTINREGSSEEGGYINFRTPAFTVPTESNKIKIKVKPVPKSDASFDGAWSSAKTFDWITDIRTVNSIDISYDLTVDRQVTASWNIESIENVGSFTYQWFYLRNGNRYYESETTTSNQYTRAIDYTVPEGAIEVYIQVKPNDNANGNIFVGDYREKTCEINIFPRSVRNLVLDMQRGSARTVVATWDIEDKENLDHYEFTWRKRIAGVWYDDQDGQTSAASPSASYDAADNVDAVEFRVAPIPTTSMAFIPDWTEYEDFVQVIPDDITPETPSAPSFSIEKLTVTAQVDSYDVNTSQIEFEIVANEGGWNKVIRSPLTYNRATVTGPVTEGKTYKARARGLNVNKESGEWSEWSSDVTTPPSALSSPPVAEAYDESWIRLTWKAVTGADSYYIEYADKTRYFDAAQEKVHNTESETLTKLIEFTGEDLGKEWFFRIRAVNRSGNSGWSKIVSAVLGKIPDAPTTWSSVTSGSIDRDIYLYWSHNCEDRSIERSAILELTVNGTTTTHTITNPDVENSSYVGSYLIAANTYSNGAVISWRVKTKGVLTTPNSGYGPYSTARTLNIYSPPVVSFDMNTLSGAIESFPITLNINSYPIAQTPIVYNVSIVSNETYDGLTETGNNIKVIAGQTIFQKNYYSSEHELTIEISPGEVDLANTRSYTIKVLVGMDSGLDAEMEETFYISWDDVDYYINCETVMNWDTYSMQIRPFCSDEEGNPVANVVLAVYRREFDGKFTLIADDISNDVQPYVTDPHPALDYARYRIVAKSTTTGKIDYYDVPSYPINETCVIFQWDEEWDGYLNFTDDDPVDKPWKGSMLILPYNVKTSDSNQIDVALTEYIGRSHPVSYYGTQVGQTSSWNTDIPADDVETIYALRRLSVYTGDVYCREPSGTGYWAHVEVSFGKEYNTPIIPVTFNLTRVEGGM